MNTSHGTSDWTYLASLIAALEQVSGRERRAVLPHLGLARAELNDFGQRRLGPLQWVAVTSLQHDLELLHDRVVTMLSSSEVLHDTLRLEAALRHVTAALEASA